MEIMVNVVVKENPWGNIPRFLRASFLGKMRSPEFRSGIFDPQRYSATFVRIIFGIFLNFQ